MQSSQVVTNIVVVQQGCVQAPDPTRPPYHVPDGHVSGLNITFMDEQAAQNADQTSTNEDSAAASSVATA